MTTAQCGRGRPKDADDEDDEMSACYFGDRGNAEVH